MDEALAELLDRDAIRRIQERYCRGTDRHDLVMVGCYWPDAIGEFGAWRGRVVELPAFASQLLKAQYANTNHIVGQCHIELDGDEAISETYCLASHHLPDDGQEEVVTDIMWCRYVDRLARREGEWRITYRQFIVDQIQRVSVADRGVMDFGAFAHGRPGSDDPSYNIFD